jgi:phosphatidylserine/phosphatidylglycerophosphate/cardiolipin synthase-like enzyme
MIHTTAGADVECLLDRVIAHPERYSEAVVCTPFLDAEMETRLVELIERASQARLCATVVTSPSCAAALRKALGGHAHSWRRVVREHVRLHAKVYVVLARRGATSEAIVTSANLTRAGVSENIEFGVRAVGDSECGRRLISEVRHFVRRIAA